MLLYILTLHLQPLYYLSNFQIFTKNILHILKLYTGTVVLSTKHKSIVVNLKYCLNIWHNFCYFLTTHLKFKLKILNWQD